MNTGRTHFKKGSQIPWNKGKKQSEEHKRKISIALKGKNTWMKGRRLSEETKKKISKNNVHYWKGKKLSEEIRNKISDTLKKRGIIPPSRLGKKHGEETKRKISKNHRRYNSEETRRKISLAQKGKKISDKKKEFLRKCRLGVKHSEETKKKMSESHKREKNHFWKGGITPENHKIRSSIEYKLFRDSVFARDGYTCQKYSIKGIKLHAHHIQNFSSYPELRFAIDNGITLSDRAHKDFHEKYGVKKNTREQLEEFLRN